MKLLITGDWHIKETYRGREGRLKDFELLRDFFLDLLKEEKPDFMIHLGDVFHTLSPFIRKDVINFGVKLFADLAQYTRVYILVGNHDKFRNECYLDFLQSENVNIISSPTVISLQYIQAGFVPHGAEEVIPSFSDVDILFLHADIIGARLSTGKVMEEGISNVPPVEFIFNGHIHLPQKIGGIICVGSPLQQDFSESREEKRVILWENGRILDISIPSFIPQFRVYEFTKKSEFKKFLKVHQENPSHDYILLRVPHTFDVSPLEGNERIFIEFLQEERVRKQEEEKPPLTVEEAMDKWIEAQELEQSDKNELKKIAREVWQECSKSVS